MSKVVVPKYTAREIAFGALIGLALLGFLAWGAWMMMHPPASPNQREGTVVARHFTPAPEEQITIGTGGLRERKIEGTYVLEVDVPGERVYIVDVNKRDFEMHKVGDRFRFLVPPAAR